MGKKLETMNGCGLNTGVLSADWCVADLIACLEKQLKMLANSECDIEPMLVRELERKDYALPQYAVSKSAMVPAGIFN